MARRQSRRHLSSGEKRLAGFTVRRPSPPFYIIIACVPQLSHLTQIPLPSERSFTIEQADPALSRHLRQIPSLHPPLARTSMLRRRPGSENSIPPSIATKMITSGRAVAGIDRTVFSIARSREPSSLFLPDEDVLPTKNVRSTAPTPDTP